MILLDEPAALPCQELDRETGGLLKAQSAAGVGLAAKASRPTKSFLAGTLQKVENTARAQVPSVLSVQEQR